MPAARDPGLDAARAVAMGGVVAAHAAISFMETPIGWAIQDRSRSLAADTGVWIARAFAMPAFFWLSGYFARAVHAAGGPAGFLRHRVTRVLMPLLVALVPCSLALAALWDWGRAVDGRAAVAAHIPKLQGSGLPITLGHLWYLYYLLALSLIAVAVVPLWRRLRVPALGPAPLLAAVSAIIVAIHALAGSLALDTPLGFGLDPRVLAYQGTFFAWGWHVHARPASLSAYARLSPFAVAAALLLLLAQTPSLLDAAASSTASPPVYALAASALFTISLVVSLLGLSLRLTRRASPLLRLASESSYWFYVAHLPLVVLLQVALAGTAIPGPLKYLAIVAVTTAVCLATYDVGRRCSTRARRAPTAGR